MITTTTLDLGGHLARVARAAALHFKAKWASASRDKPRDPASEAAAVREMAMLHRATDPGFAADLLAAADRHELAGSPGPSRS